MGRGKLELKHIENEKSRITTYQKRKKGLKKKVEEFSILCGVPTCMIIYGPKMKNRPPEVEVWPEEANAFMEVVNLYREKAFPSSHGIKAYNLLDFLNERKQKVDDKANKLRRSNLESKFPCCWDDRLNGFTLDQLRALLVTFDNNIEVARRRIAMIKGEDHHHHNNSHQVLIQNNNIELADPFTKQFVNPLDAIQLYQPTFYFDPTAMMVDNMMINNQRAPMYLCGHPSMQTMQHYEQYCPPLPSNNTPQMHGSYPQFNEFYKDTWMNELGIKSERGNE